MACTLTLWLTGRQAWLNRFELVNPIMRLIMPPVLLSGRLGVHLVHVSFILERRHRLQASWCMKCIPHFANAEHSRCLKGCCARRLVPGEGQCTVLVLKTGPQLQCSQESTLRHASLTKRIHLKALKWLIVIKVSYLSNWCVKLSF